MQHLNKRAKGQLIKATNNAQESGSRRISIPFKSGDELQQRIVTVAPLKEMVAFSER
jgi:hypothetical protein